MIRRAHISTQNTKPDWPVLDGQANTRRNKVAAVGTGPQQRCCCWHRSLSKTGPEPTKPDAYFAGSGAIRGALRSAKTSSVQNPRWALCHVRQESASTSGQTAYVTILRNMISPLVRQKNTPFQVPHPDGPQFPVSLCYVRNRTPPSQASSDAAEDC
jgi:hypothetical protein